MKNVFSIIRPDEILDPAAGWTPAPPANSALPKRARELLSFYQLFSFATPAPAAFNAVPKRLLTTSAGHRPQGAAFPCGAAAKTSLFLNVSPSAGPPSPTAKARRSESICNLHFTICNLLSPPLAMEQHRNHDRASCSRTLTAANPASQDLPHPDVRGGTF